MGYHRKQKEKRINNRKLKSMHNGYMPRGYYFDEEKGRIVKLRGFRPKQLKFATRLKNKKVRRDKDIYIKGSYYKNKSGNVIWKIA